MALPTFIHDRMARTVTDERFQQKDIVLLRPVFGAMTNGEQETTFEPPPLIILTILAISLPTTLLAPSSGAFILGTPPPSA